MITYKTGLPEAITEEWWQRIYNTVATTKPRQFQKNKWNWVTSMCYRWIINLDKDQFDNSRLCYSHSWTTEIIVEREHWTAQSLDNVAIYWHMREPPLGMKEPNKSFSKQVKMLISKMDQYSYDDLDKDNPELELIMFTKPKKPVVSIAEQNRIEEGKSFMFKLLIRLTILFVILLIIYLIKNS